MSHHFICVTFLLLNYKLAWSQLSTFGLNQRVNPAINPCAWAKCLFIFNAKDIICSGSSHLSSFSCRQISKDATRRRSAPYHLHNTATKKWQTDIDTCLTQMSPKIYPTQNKICVLNELAGAPSVKHCAGLGRTSVADASIGLAKWGRRTNENLLIWCHKKSFKYKCNIIKSTTTDRIWCLNCQQVLEIAVSATVGDASWLREYFVLAVVAGANRLPAVVAQTAARLSVQSFVFLWTERNEVWQLSFRKNYFRHQGFLRDFFKQVVLLLLAITAWNDVPRWAEFQKDIKFKKKKKKLFCILALKPFITNKFAGSHNVSFWMLGLHVVIKSSIPGFRDLEHSTEEQKKD